MGRGRLPCCGCCSEKSNRTQERFVTARTYRLRTTISNARSTIAFDAPGEVAEYVGGYNDWLRQHAASTTPSEADATIADRGEPKESRRVKASVAEARRKLTYNEQRELKALPARIETLEAEHSRLEASVAASDFYKAGAG